MIETLQQLTPQKNLNNGIRCKNTSGEEMPAFAAFMIGSEVSGVVQAIKPNEDSAKQVLLGPPNAVPANGIFFSRSPYDEFSAVTGTVAIGDTLGTASGSWQLSTDQTGFVATGGDSGGVARVRFFSGGGADIYDYNVGFEYNLGSSTSGIFYSPYADLTPQLDSGVYDFYTKSVSSPVGLECDSTISEAAIQADIEFYNGGTRLLSSQLTVLRSVDGSSGGLIAASLDSQGYPVTRFRIKVSISIPGTGTAYALISIGSIVFVKR